jgi:hypothetical protein
LFWRTPFAGGAGDKQPRIGFKDFGGLKHNNLTSVVGGDQIWKQINHTQQRWNQHQANHTLQAVIWQKDDIGGLNEMEDWTLERRDAKPIRRTRKQWCRGITLRATTPLGYIEKTEVGYEGLKRRQRCTSLALETRKKD